MTRPFLLPPGKTPRKHLVAIAIVVAVAAVASAGILFWDGGPLSRKTETSSHAEEKDKDDHGSHEGEKEEKGDKGKGMTVKSDTGKKEKDADGHAHAGEPTIAFTEAQIKASEITLAQAGPGKIKQSLRLPGEIRYNEDRTAHVVPRVAGVVESVSANLGQKVTKGQILATIASSAVSDQRSELLSAQRRLSLAQLTFEREKKLWEQKITAEQDYLQARQALQEAEIAVGNARQKLTAMGAGTATGGVLNRYELRAPFDGMVMEKHIALGEAVKEDAQVFTLSDLSTVWAEINVSAKDLPHVRVGGKAKVTATAFDATAEGTIAYVGSLIGEQTRTARGRVVLPNPQGAWRPGLFANIEIIATELDVALTVASEAIQTIENNPVVFVRNKDGFIPRRVKVGRTDGQFTEILEGLDKGDRYASGGSYTLKAEAGKGSTEHAH